MSFNERASRASPRRPLPFKVCAASTGRNVKSARAQLCLRLPEGRPSGEFSEMAAGDTTVGSRPISSGLSAILFAVKLFFFPT